MNLELEYNIWWMIDIRNLSVSNVIYHITSTFSVTGSSDVLAVALENSWINEKKILKSLWSDSVS